MFALNFNARATNLMEEFTKNTLLVYSFGEKIVSEVIDSEATRCNIFRLSVINIRIRHRERREENRVPSESTISS